MPNYQMRLVLRPALRAPFPFSWTGFPWLCQWRISFRIWQFVCIVIAVIFYGSWARGTVVPGLVSFEVMWCVFSPFKVFSKKRLVKTFSYKKLLINNLKKHFFLIIIIIIIIYELIVRGLTWEWSAAHYNYNTLKGTKLIKDNALKNKK